MRLIKATEAHLRIAADDLCASDLHEFHCMKAGRNPRDVLPAAHDENTQAILLGSLVLAVGGHTSLGIWFVTTNVSDFDSGQVVVHAEDPAGPWSDPAFVPNAIGIDPDLTWDDQGHCYLT